MSVIMLTIKEFEGLENSTWFFSCAESSQADLPVKSCEVAVAPQINHKSLKSMDEPNSLHTSVLTIINILQ